MESNGFAIFMLLFILFMVIGSWKMFVKAGLPGWGVLIPIYNIYLLCKLADKPVWWMVLFFIPVINIIIACFVIPISISQKFGKGLGFGLGMIFFPFIFTPILGFGSAQYSN